MLENNDKNGMPTLQDEEALLQEVGKLRRRK